MARIISSLSLISLVWQLVFSGLIVTFLLYEYENDFDQQHKSTSDVFRVIYPSANRRRNAKVWGGAISLGPNRRRRKPGNQGFHQIWIDQCFFGTVRRYPTSERINFADPAFFDFFSFQLPMAKKRCSGRRAL
jgi:hypothetical protein